MFRGTSSFFSDYRTLLDEIDIPTLSEISLIVIQHSLFLSLFHIFIACRFAAKFKAFPIFTVFAAYLAFSISQTLFFHFYCKIYYKTIFDSFPNENPQAHNTLMDEDHNEKKLKVFHTSDTRTHTKIIIKKDLTIGHSKQAKFKTFRYLLKKPRL